MYEELYRNVKDIAQEAVRAKQGDEGAQMAPYLLRTMHQTLELACHEALKDSGHACGNLFSQVDVLCKTHHIRTPDMIAIQQMRRHSNKNDTIDANTLLYDARALALFISAVSGTDIPSWLTSLIPHKGKPGDEHHHTDWRYIRCIARGISGTTLTADTEQGFGREGSIEVDLSDGRFAYLLNNRHLLHEGTQLNLLDCQASGTKVVPWLVVAEPDFVIDISAIAACFSDYGHHPLSYTVNRMGNKANTQATLLGNLAGSVLDDVIHTNTGYNLGNTLRNSFQAKALEYCACQGFNGAAFKRGAEMQAGNIASAVDVLFARHNRQNAVLEPSFVCERLGLQGRIDLMTTDFRLLVEQKSGRNTCIENNRPNAHGSMHIEQHYVQLLLYYGVLRYNFNLNPNNSDIRLLYSKYPPAQGLMSVAFYRQLFGEVIKTRNLIVANEIFMATQGFEHVVPHLTPATLNTTGTRSAFYHQYLYPRLEAATGVLHTMQPTMHAYFCRMMTFVYREQMLAKLGNTNLSGSAAADKWNMPLSQKREAGNIYTNLEITEMQATDGHGYDTVTLKVPMQGNDFLPNFRRGDMVYLYSYADNATPDLRHSILYKGCLTHIGTTSITVKLTDGQQNPGTIYQCRGTNRLFAIEHAGGDAQTSAAISGLHTLATAPPHRQQLLLGQRQPGCDTSVTLSQSYNESYDKVILQAMQATDYYLLIGPPGTGKTSMAIRFMVQEELQRPQSTLLLMAYTNRAVDEICDMLTDAGLPFLRLGNEYSCDERFKDHLISRVSSHNPQLGAMRTVIQEARIITCTTSMLAARPYLLDIKSFSLAIIDEASQILEPSIIGLLAAHRTMDDGTKHCRIGRFILTGDYKQLPAVVQQNEQESAVSNPLLHGIHLTNCRNSLFERLINIERAAGRTHTIGILRKQGRMHPDIARFPNTMFYPTEHLQPVPLPHQTELNLSYTLPAQDALDQRLKDHRMIYIPSELCRRPGLSDKANISEGEIVATLVQRIMRFYGNRFNPAKTLGVIVPYRNQIAIIRQAMERAGIKGGDQISIDTVERYQGSQRDVIIYSFTVQNIYQLEFLTSNCFVEQGRTIDRKLNVALTRARKQMIITGNEEVLSANPLFSKLIRFVRNMENGYKPHC